MNYKSHNIENTENSLTLTVNLEQRTLAREPVQVFNHEDAENLLKEEGINLSQYTGITGPAYITNYASKATTTPPTLTGTWTLTKKQKKEEKNRINETTKPSNSKKRTRTRRTKKTTTN